MTETKPSHENETPNKWLQMFENWKMKLKDNETVLAVKKFVEQMRPEVKENPRKAIEKLAEIDEKELLNPENSIYDAPLEKEPVKIYTPEYNYKENAYDTEINKPSFDWEKQVDKFGLSANNWESLPKITKENIVTTVFISKLKTETISMHPKLKEAWDFIENEVDQFTNTTSSSSDIAGVVPGSENIRINPHILVNTVQNKDKNQMIDLVATLFHESNHIKIQKYKTDPTKIPRTEDANLAFETKQGYMLEEAQCWEKGTNLFQEVSGMRHSRTWDSEREEYNQRYNRFPDKKLLLQNKLSFGEKWEIDENGYVLSIEETADIENIPEEITNLTKLVLGNEELELKSLKTPEGNFFEFQYILEDLDNYFDNLVNVLVKVKENDDHTGRRGFSLGVNTEISIIDDKGTSHNMTETVRTNALVEIEGNFASQTTGFHITEHNDQPLAKISSLKTTRDLVNLAHELGHSREPIELIKFNADGVDILMRYLANKTRERDAWSDVLERLETSGISINEEKLESYKNEMLQSYERMAEEFGITQEIMSEYKNVFPDFEQILQMFRGEIDTSELTQQTNIESSEPPEKQPSSESLNYDTAVFNLLQNIAKIQEKRSVNGISNTATINDGENVSDAVQSATDLDLDTLSNSKDTAPYQPLSWAEFKEPEDEDDEYGPSTGSHDMRIIDSTRQGIKFVSIFANAGNLTGTESWWTEACNVDYPMIVSDRKGFEYKNEAYLKAENTGPS